MWSGWWRVRCGASAGVRSGNENLYYLVFLTGNKTRLHSKLTGKHRSAGSASGGRPSSARVASKNSRWRAMGERCASMAGSGETMAKKRFTIRTSVVAMQRGGQGRVNSCQRNGFHFGQVRGLRWCQIASHAVVATLEQQHMSTHRISRGKRNTLALCHCKIYYSSTMICVQLMALQASSAIHTRVTVSPRMRSKKAYACSASLWT